MLEGLVEGVGVGVAEVEGEAWAAPAAAFPAGEPESDLPETSKTTMLAVMPLGTVTTQKLAPPAPAAEREDSTFPMPSLAGLMEQGVPLQPSPEQTIFTPKVGAVLESQLLVQIGL